MVDPTGRFVIEEDLDTKAIHHESFSDLWETKWKVPCELGVYPFMFGCLEDFQPIANDLIHKDMRSPYDWDAYAAAFFPKAEELLGRATAAGEAGETEKASELYLRASAVYRIARFPLETSKNQVYAWLKGKEACLRGLQLRYPRMSEEHIPHTHAGNGDGSLCPVYFALPVKASDIEPVPLVIIISGLDGHRTELAVWIEGWLNVGVAVMIVEIPGTGDHPGNLTDPKSPDRVWDSVFEWLGKRREIQQSEIVVWGFSTGGYYALRVAHTNAERIKGAVCHGGGSHFMFHEKWLENIDGREHPFPASPAMAQKSGFGDDVKQFKKEAMKFSLLETGILDTPECAKILLVNGIGDEIFPIDDCYIALQHGDPKEARFVPHTKHMGEPTAFLIIIPWIYKLLDIKADVKDQLRTVPFKPKY